MKRGEIYYADLSPTIGSEQDGDRPVLILQNDTGNLFSPTVIVAPFTTQRKRTLPTHIQLSSVSNLKSCSLLLLEQIRTIDKSRINDYVGTVNENELLQINKKINISLGLV